MHIFVVVRHCDFFFFVSWMLFLFFCASYFFILGFFFGFVLVSSSTASLSVVRWSFEVAYKTSESLKRVYNLANFKNKDFKNEFVRSKEFF